MCNYYQHLESIEVFYLWIYVLYVYIYIRIIYHVHMFFKPNIGRYQNIGRYVVSIPMVVERSLKGSWTFLHLRIATDQLTHTQVGNLHFALPSAWVFGHLSDGFFLGCVFWMTAKLRPGRFWEKKDLKNDSKRHSKHLKASRLMVWCRSHESIEICQGRLKNLKTKTSTLDRTGTLWRLWFKLGWIMLKQI